MHKERTLKWKKLAATMNNAFGLIQLTLDLFFLSPSIATSSQIGTFATTNYIITKSKTSKSQHPETSRFNYSLERKIIIPKKC